MYCFELKENDRAYVLLPLHRLMTKQTPFWSTAPIGPYPERAWPVITFRDAASVHFAGEDIELDHYANAHTDSDSVVYFARANVVAVGDLFAGEASLVGSADIDGLVRSLSAVLNRINDHTIILTGHGEMSNRGDLAQFFRLVNETITLCTTGNCRRQERKGGDSPRLARLWKPWFAPDAVPAGDEFLQGVYATLTHTNHLNQ